MGRWIAGRLIFLAIVYPNAKGTGNWMTGELESLIVESEQLDMEPGDAQLENWSARDGRLLI